MKKLIIFILVFSMFLPMISVSAGRGDNISGWITEASNTNSSVTLDGTVKYSGEYSVCLKNNPVGEKGSVSINSVFSSVQGETYEISFYAKSEGTSSAIVSVGNTSYSVDGTYTWKKYTFRYNETTAAGTAKLYFILSGKSNGLWIDNVIVKKIDSSENLIDNPGFEKRSAASSEAETENEPVADSVDGVEYYDINEYYAGLGTSSYIPINQADGIKIDGDNSDWGNYHPIIPEKVKYFQNVSSVAIDMNFKMAYDDEKCYICVEVHDEKYITATGDNYWRNDCLQMAFGLLGETFGDEYGVTLDMNNNEPFFKPESLKNNVELEITKNGDDIVYEMAIPWTAPFEEKPDSFKFCILAADDTGKTRDYVLMLAPGIEEHKVNKSFPVIVPVTDDIKVMSWIEGSEEIGAMSENDYTLCILNTGEAFDTDVRLSDAGIDKRLTVPAKSYLRIPFKFRWDTVEKKSLAAEMSSNIKVFEKNVNIVPTYEMYEPKIKELSERIKELETLISSAEAHGYSVEYEKVNLQTIKLFEEFIMQDFTNGDTSRMEYTFRCLDDLYKEAKEDLMGYLSRTKESKPVPRYITSDVTLNGSMFYADTITNDSTVENRPVFLYGHGHSHEVYNYQNILNDLGQNYRQFQLSPTHFLRKGSEVPWWQGAAAECLVEMGKDGGHCIELQRNEEKENYSISQCRIVKPGREYTLSFDYKTQNAGNVWYSYEDYSNRRFLDTSNGDWRHVEFKFNGHYTGINTLRFYIQDFAEAVWIDNISITSAEEEELVSNGDFEMLEHDTGFEYSFSSISNGIYKYHEAAEMNIACSLLLGSHVMPGWLTNEHPEARRSTYFSADLTNEYILSAYKFCAQVVARIAETCDSISDIVIHNEGRYNIHTDPAFLPLYQSRLEEMYGGDISKLNSNYGTTYTGFDEVPMPDADMFNPTPERYDMAMINNNIFINWQKAMYDEIKKLLPNMNVQAKLQSPITFMRHDYGGTYFTDAVDPYLAAKLYGIHGLDGGQEYDGTIFIKDSFASGNVNNFFMTCDYLTSIVNTPILNTEDHMTANGNFTITPDIADHIERYTWQSAVHGRGTSAVWTWSRSTTDESIRGHLTYRPDAMAAYGRTGLDTNRLSYEIEALQQADRKVGILFSQAARAYKVWYHTTTVSDVYTAITTNGQRPLFVMDEMPENIEGLDMLYIPYTPNVPEKILRAISDYQDKGGKVYIIGRDSLERNEYNQPHAPELVAKVKNNSVIFDAEETGDNKYLDYDLSELTETVYNQMCENGVNEIQLIDVATGKIIQNVEWQYAEYNGKMLVNAASFADYGDIRNFKVMYNGKEIRNLRDLRSGTLFYGAVEIKPSTPLLLQFELRGGL